MIAPVTSKAAATGNAALPASNASKKVTWPVTALMQMRVRVDLGAAPATSAVRRVTLHVSAQTMLEVGIAARVAHRLVSAIVATKLAILRVTALTKSKRSEVVATSDNAERREVSGVTLIQLESQEAGAPKGLAVPVAGVISSRLRLMVVGRVRETKLPGGGKTRLKTPKIRMKTKETEEVGGAPTPIIHRV